MIDGAAKATRKYVQFNDGTVMDSTTYKTVLDFPNCDRLNLIAVLDELREPTKAMVRAATDATGQFDIGHEYATAWLAMIDALIGEVRDAV